MCQIEIDPAFRVPAKSAALCRTDWHVPLPIGSISSSPLWLNIYQDYIYLKLYRLQGGYAIWFVTKQPQYYVMRAMTNSDLDQTSVRTLSALFVSLLRLAWA